MRSPFSRLFAPLALAWLVLVMLVGTLAPVAFARDVPPLRGRVVDLANMISPRAEGEIAKISADLERTDSTQVVVLTVPSLEGESLEDYALRVAETWGLGQQDRDNGVLILVAKAERRMRIEVGYGLEGRLTDLLSGRIIDTVVSPRFKAGDMDGGFVAGAMAVSQAVRGEFKGTGKTGGRDGGGFSALGMLLFFIVLGPLSLLGRLARFSGRSSSGRSHAGGFWMGGGGFGGGGFGGGGFGGGGGGFGGGGASGGW